MDETTYNSLLTGLEPILTGWNSEGNFVNPKIDNDDVSLLDMIDMRNEDVKQLREENNKLKDELAFINASLGIGDD